MAAELEEIHEEYRRGAPQGADATARYLAALDAAVKAGGEPGEIYGAALDAAFGLRPDTPQAAAAAAAAARGYHPLQGMAYSPQAIEEGEGAACDISHPRSRLAVDYRLRRLTDREAALAFGPLASLKTGLSSALIARMATIEVRSARGARRPAARATAPLLVPGPLRVSTDGMRTQVMPRGDLWAPFAGPRPRAAARTGAAAARVEEALAAQTARWRDLAADFVAAGRARALPPGVAGETRLLETAIVEFGAAYDAAPPATLRDLRAILGVDDEPSPRAPPSRAIAVLSEDGAVERARDGVRRGADPARALTEARLTAAVKGGAAARELWRRLRLHLRPDREWLDAPEPRRRTLIEREFRRGLAAAIAEGPVPCGEMTIKLYSLGE